MKAHLIEIKNDLKVSLQDLKEKLTSKAVQRSLADAAREFIATIEFIAPKMKGDYARSYRITHMSLNTITIATPKGALAEMLERGTTAHPIFPKKAKVLHWEENGEDFFAFYVSHPGFSPRKHIEPTVQHVASQIHQIVKRSIDSEVR